MRLHASDEPSVELFFLWRVVGVEDERHCFVEFRADVLKRGEQCRLLRFEIGVDTEPFVRSLLHRVQRPRKRGRVE